MSKEENRELFLFAAKTGALEGYLFERRDVEPLSSWIENIDKMYRDLPPAVKKEIVPVFASVLKRILEYGAGVLEPGLREKVERMLREASEGGGT